MILVQGLRERPCGVEVGFALGVNLSPTPAQRYRGVPFKPDEEPDVRVAGYWIGPSHSVQREKGARVLRNVAAVLLGRGRVCVSIRHLLSWFTFQRRSKWNVKTIRSELSKAGLRTHPDFTEGNDLDAIVRFRSRPLRGPRATR